MNIFKKLFHKETITIAPDDPCEGCLWRELKRHQKCSTCRRNQNMKDNYKLACTASEGGVKRE